MSPARSWRAALVVAGVVAVLCWVGVLGSWAGVVGYLPDRVLVQFLPGTPASAIARAHANAGARILGEIPHIGVQIAQLPPGLTLAGALDLYLRNPNVSFAEPDAFAAPDAIPDDPLYASQWHLPKISAPAAWDATTGASSVVIAILDTGVDPTHPDLAPKLVPGWNAYSNTSDTHDVCCHGTTTAGAAAAIGNNALGVAGVAWNCQLMPIRISDTTGYAYYSTAASGLTWAADHGARVANLSYEFTGSSSVSSAAQYFQSKGGVVTISAGNDSSALTLPDNPYILTVGATDSADHLASWSNTGPVIDVVAPGVGILTTTKGGGYGSASGTSYSAPLTAGVAALVLSANPSLSGQQVQDIIKQSADDLGGAGWDPTYGYGRVNAAAAVALALSTPHDTKPPTVSFTAPADGATVSGTLSVQVSAVDNAAVAAVALSVDGVALGTDTSSPYSFSWNTTNVPNGVHALTATATDTSGNVASVQIGVTVQNGVPDTTPPTVAITYPVSGAALASKGSASTSLSVQVSAADNVGVAKVQLYLDGVLAGTSATSPYKFSLNTKKWASGPHLLQAKAYDAAGNSGFSQPVTVYK